MKKIIYTIVGVGLLFACSKNEVEIQKNLDTSWEIDKKFKENDIREIIGYDPRFDYIYFTEETTEVPMLSLANIPLTGQNKRNIELRKFDKPLLEDLQLTIAYDTSIYDKIKNSYSGFELGDASLVKITEATKTMTKGTKSVTFEIVTENKSDLDKKLIIPFSVKANNDNVKGVTGKDYFIVKILPKKVTVSAEETEINKTLFFKNGDVTASDSEITITLKSSDKLPSGIKVGLMRDASALPNGKTIAPDGVEKTIAQVDFDSTSPEISFELDLTKFPKQLGQYTLPLKWLLYDSTGKSYELENNVVLVNIEVKRQAELIDNPNNSVGSHDNPTGKKIPHTAITFQYEKNESTGNPERMVDGKYQETTYFKGTNGQYLHFTFDKERIIKSIHFKTKSTHTIGSCAVYGYDSVKDEFRTQGTATFTETGGDYTITFKEAIPVDYLAIGEFFSTRDRSGAWFEIYEAEFYEE